MSFLSRESQVAGVETLDLSEGQGAHHRRGISGIASGLGRKAFVWVRRGGVSPAPSDFPLLMAFATVAPRPGWLALGWVSSPSRLQICVFADRQKGQALQATLITEAESTQFGSELEEQSDSECPVPNPSQGPAQVSGGSS